MTGRFGIVAGVLALVICATIAAAPAKKPAAKAEQNTSGIQTKNMRIETTVTNSNVNTGVFTMPQHVKFSRPGTDVVGDSAHGNTNDELVTITGHVVLHDSGNAPEASQAGAAPGSGPATLLCDELQIDAKRRIYVATGNVHFVQGDQTFTGNSGRLDQGSHQLDLSGNVRLTKGSQTFSGQFVHYNTVTKDLNTSGDPVILTAPAPPGSAGSSKPTLPTPAPKKK
jgi:lipopolysaccharide assembly outer membrane protein LptD (OstA)